MRYYDQENMDFIRCHKCLKYIWVKFDDLDEIVWREKHKCKDRGEQLNTFYARWPNRIAYGSYAGNAFLKTQVDYDGWAPDDVTSFSARVTPCYFLFSKETQRLNK